MEPSRLLVHCSVLMEEGLIHTGSKYKIYNIQVSWFEREVGTSLGMENMTFFPLKYYNFEMRGLSGKATRKGMPVL